MPSIVDRGRVRGEYPSDGRSLLDDSMTFKPDAIRALRKFKREKTFRKSSGERLDAMRILVGELAEVYGLQSCINNLFFVENENSNGSYSPISGEIVLRGKLSIITLLHEFAHARGYREYGAVRWSLNLFRKVYPRQFERLTFRGHMAVSQA